MANAYFVESQDYVPVRELVKDSKTRVVIIYGGHGIGKTCLARRLLVDLVERDGWKTYTMHTRTREMYQMSSQAIIRSERHRMDFPPKFKPTIFELAEKLWKKGDTLLILLEELQLEGERVDMYWPNLTPEEHSDREHADQEHADQEHADPETFDKAWLRAVIQQIKKCTERKEPNIKLLLTLKQKPSQMETELRSQELHQYVKWYQMMGFSPENTRVFLHSYTNSDIVLRRYEDINKACSCVPLLHKAVGSAFSAMNDPDEVDEYLYHIQQERGEIKSGFRPSMIVLRNIHQLIIWKIVRQLGRTLIPKDLIIAIIIEYKESTDSMKPVDVLVDDLRPTEIFTMMRSDFMKNELMAESREGILREQIYFTIHQITWNQLRILIDEDAEELQLLYKRLALRAIAAVIEFDDRFHAYTKETPSKLSYAQNHTERLFHNFDDTQLNQLGEFERFLHYRLLLGVYYPKRKLGTATQADVDALRNRIEAFERAFNSARKRNDIDKGRLEFDKESRKLCEMWLKRQRFTDRDKDFIIKYLELFNVKVKVDPRRHLQNEDYESKTDLIALLRASDLLLGEEAYQKVIFEETRAVMYILLSKMKRHSSSFVGSKIDELVDEDLKKACDIFAELEKENKVLFLQHAILKRDLLILELPDDKTRGDEYSDNEQGRMKVIEKCDELIEKYKKLYETDSEKSDFAYEFGFARSKPSADNYHMLVCLERMLDIHGRKVLAVRRGGGDDERQCYADARKVLTEIKECINKEEENNRPRAYAYALRHVAGFLSSIKEVGLAFRYYSFALTRLQQYSVVIKEMPMSKEVEMSIYGKICENIIKLKESERSPERRPGVEIFDECFCISRFDGSTDLVESTDSSAKCECEVDDMRKNYIKPMLEEPEVKANEDISKALQILFREFSTTAAVSE